MYRWCQKLRGIRKWDVYFITLSEIFLGRGRMETGLPGVVRIFVTQLVFTRGKFNSLLAIRGAILRRRRRWNYIAITQFPRVIIEWKE